MTILSFTEPTMFSCNVMFISGIMFVVLTSQFLLFIEIFLRGEWKLLVKIKIPCQINTTVFTNMKCLLQVVQV